MASTRTASGREDDISQFGAVGQTVTRMSNLADDVIWNGPPKSILDPFSSQIASSAAHKRLLTRHVTEGSARDFMNGAMAGPPVREFEFP